LDKSHVKDPWIKKTPMSKGWKRLETEGMSGPALRLGKKRLTGVKTPWAAPKKEHIRHQGPIHIH
jgi:hypothetical protein